MAVQAGPFRRRNPRAKPFKVQVMPHLGRRQAQRRRQAKFKIIAGKPGVPSPTVQPFMKSEDQLAYGEAQSKLAQTLGELDFNLENQRIGGQYEKSQIDRSAVQSRADTNDAMASRGLFHSSVRDAELYDIDATAALRKSYLDRQLDTNTLQAETQKKQAQNAWDAFQSGINQKMVENAQEVQLNMGKWITPPTPDKRVKIKPRHRQPNHPGHGNGRNQQAHTTRRPLPNLRVNVTKKPRGRLVRPIAQAGNG